MQFRLTFASRWVSWDAASNLQLSSFPLNFRPPASSAHPLLIRYLTSVPWLFGATICPSLFLCPVNGSAGTREKPSLRPATQSKRGVDSRRTENMGEPFRPVRRLSESEILGKMFQVPESDTVLRSFK